jgi:hypothetical protein
MMENVSMPAIGKATEGGGTTTTIGTAAVTAIIGITTAANG